MRDLKTCGVWLALSAAAMTWTAPAAAAPSENAPSPFIQCDGRVGHVSSGTRFMRLLLVAATAGISEAAMSSDDESKRAKGLAGVAACDAAIAKETDLYRRAQLGLARSLHFGEAGDWANATEAARAVPRLASSGGRDWALDRTVLSAAANLEAWALLQQGKLTEAEEVQAVATVRAGSDVLALQRVAPYMRLTNRMNEAKRRAYWHLYRYYPRAQGQLVHGFADARRYADARLALAGQGAMYRALSSSPERTAGRASLDAALAAMDGKIDEAKASLASAQHAFASERAAGTLADGASVVDEQIAFATAAIAAAEGRLPEARRLLTQRTLWGMIAGGMLSDLVERLSAGATPTERTGVLADDPNRASKDFTRLVVAKLKEDSARKRQWSTLFQLVVDDYYKPMVRQAYTGSSSKPKWLLKPDKDDPAKFDLLYAPFAGPAVNEPLMLHAALIARSRAKTGFILTPIRKQTDIVGVRFVNAGEDGLLPQSVIRADDVISELSPHMPLEAS